MSKEDTVNSLWVSNPTNDPDALSSLSWTFRDTPKASLKKNQVAIRAHYSSINYKDALAVTGNGKILRNLPLVPGIDVSGVVVDSRDPNFSKGQEVIVTGCGIGESISGGYSQYLSVPGKDVILAPEHLSLKEAMIFGTAGFTAALAIHQLEHNGLSHKKGEVLVTGATGGVGCLSLQIMKKLGYQTRAWTRKEELCPWLLDMGATAAESISGKDFQTRPLSSSQWAAAIDNVGDEYLSYILPRIQLWGSVASVGLAKSPLLQSTVFPFILRGVNLLGISSNNCPAPLREEIWRKLANDYRPKNLEDCLSAELGLEDIPDYCEKMIAGKTKGRALVRIH